MLQTFFNWNFNQHLGVNEAQKAVQQNNTNAIWFRDVRSAAQYMQSFESIVRKDKTVLKSYTINLRKMI